MPRTATLGWAPREGDHARGRRSRGRARANRFIPRRAPSPFFLTARRQLKFSMANDAKEETTGRARTLILHEWARMKMKPLTLFAPPNEP
jgi:hypothetical protein